MNASPRLGLLGGTFDPIHFGHLDAADAARRSLHLDEVRLIPSHDPPHRPADPHASGFHRFALVALAIQGQPAYRAAETELTRKGRSYTADTLRAIHAEGWRPSQLFFILGADAFAEIATWREFPAVLDAAHFVVVARPGTTLDAAVARTPELRGRMRYARDGTQATAAPSIFLVEAHTRDVSSTAIRARLAAGQSIDDLVPASVEGHILAHQLYGAVGNLHGQDQGIQR
ncbi:MAG TPA: nicotinate-nucleotide adenylyltransferase [Vicinamibacterales bacterium]|nr:nicotinate-nucleotide adenylyltransferase [Vicinamibacterales bacterium]